MKSFVDSMHVLGLEDRPNGDQNLVCEEFEEQLVRSPEGWYETSLLWKGNHPPLPNSKQESLKRLDHLMRKLEKQPRMLQKYENIIQDQLTQGIMEQALKEPEGKEFYLPRKAIERETAGCAKICIVYDESVQSSRSAHDDEQPC